ncbi:MAG: OmpA family protein [Rikenellaceae bacterium]
MKKALFILLALPLMAFGQSFDESENLRVVGTIYYERNVFETTVEEQEVLQDILLKMQVDNQMRVYIVGFCDRWGGVEVNDKFSYARAIYIANWLRSHGIWMSRSAMSARVSTPTPRAMPWHAGSRF